LVRGTDTQHQKKFRFLLYFQSLGNVASVKNVHLVCLNRKLLLMRVALVQIIPESMGIFSPSKRRFSILHAVRKDGTPGWSGVGKGYGGGGGGGGRGS
jgi:hypothetical protein